MSQNSTTIRMRIPLAGPVAYEILERLDLLEMLTPRSSRLDEPWAFGEITADLDAGTAVAIASLLGAGAATSATVVFPQATLFEGMDGGHKC